MDLRRAPPPAAAALDSPPEDSRERLMLAALRLFASQGYAKTSTRELAEAASVNVAAISYYFGDKAGPVPGRLSDAVGPPEDDIARFADPGLSLAQVLQGFYERFPAAAARRRTSPACA